MPLGMKLIIALNAFSLFTSAIKLARITSWSGQTWTGLSVYSMLTGTIVPVFVISAIYLRKWRTPILALLGLNIIVYIGTFFKLMTSSAAEIAALQGKKLPDNMAALSPEKLEHIFNTAKVITAGTMSIGLMLGLFIFLYVYKNRAYFLYDTTPAAEQQ